MSLLTSLRILRNLLKRKDTPQENLRLVLEVELTRRTDHQLNVPRGTFAVLARLYGCHPSYVGRLAKGLGIGVAKQT